MKQFRAAVLVIALFALAACSGGGESGLSAQSKRPAAHAPSTAVADVTTTVVTTMVPAATVPITEPATTEPLPTVAPVTGAPETSPPETAPPPVAATAPPVSNHNCRVNPVWCSPIRGTVGGNCDAQIGQYGNAPNGDWIYCAPGPNATYVWVLA